jgi:glutamyl-tRNA synthetase
MQTITPPTTDPAGDHERMTHDATLPGLRPDTTEVRVRLAPSPTGSVHIGNVKTGLYNWLLARGQAKRLGLDGSFLLRIEDTDRNRYVEDAAEQLLDILRWFGLEWQEGPDVGGPYAPYVQSERLPMFRERATHLVAQGKAYPCFCTPERLQAVREAQQARHEPTGYDRHCRVIPPAEADARVTAGEPHVIRFKTPRDGETIVDDLIRGPITTANATLEDAVLLKTDGYPTYHLAHIVDDHLMAITHVIRGAEWIPSAPLHVLIYAAFDWDLPAFIHVPLILAPGGGKLSKRHGATTMAEFRDQGYLPEALMNYLALLGWSFDATTEIFTPEDLLEKFSVERLSASPAIFDYDKLRWFNQHYINHILTLDDLTGRVMPFLARAGMIEAGAARTDDPRHALVREATALLKDRLETLADAPEHMAPFLVDDLPDYDSALLVPKKTEPAAARRGLEATLALLPGLDLADEAATEVRLRALAEELGLKTGQLFMAIRVAATGRTQSPGLFGTLRVIGPDRLRHRLIQAVGRLDALSG